MMVGTMTPATDAAREAIADIIAENVSGPDVEGYDVQEAIRIEQLAAADRILALTEAATQPREGDIVAWRERDGDEWVYYDAESDTGKHIAEHQRQWHNVRVFPLYALTQRPPEQAGAVPAGEVERLRKFAEPFVAHWEPWMGDREYHKDDDEMSCFARVTFGQLRDLRAALSAALSAAPTPPDAGRGEIPAGMVLMPSVATREMVDAADACTDAYEAYGKMVEVGRVR